MFHVEIWLNYELFFPRNDMLDDKDIYNVIKY